jgi:ribosomal protein S17E
MIQSAGEFAKIALDVYSDEVLPKDQHNIDILSNLVRSRDKAIVETCKGYIKRLDGVHLGAGDLFTTTDIMQALDSVLREISG